MRKTESGVSAVIGVILMLLVTLVLAAAIAAIASGIISPDSSDTTPVSGFVFQYSSKDSSGNYVFEMVRGYEIDNSSVLIIYSDPNNNAVPSEVKKIQTTSENRKISLENRCFAEPPSFSGTADKINWVICSAESLNPVSSGSIWN